MFDSLSTYKKIEAGEIPEETVLKIAENILRRESRNYAIGIFAHEVSDKLHEMQALSFASINTGISIERLLTLFDMKKLREIVQQEDQEYMNKLKKQEPLMRKLIQFEQKNDEEIREILNECKEELEKECKILEIDKDKLK